MEICVFYLFIMYLFFSSNHQRPSLQLFPYSFQSCKLTGPEVWPEPKACSRVEFGHAPSVRLFFILL
ncbi:hypothetical protein XELAEV_18019764mg [Xenopus laevis]|uniref:Uncharacterized protein n=1 Tax=Xenopus laevis TaxID=8355 RepID=A0A974D5U5_XENLA|nr:hypothetical protein XELAEV_18019764mg [Xenopus laevis]